MKTRIAFGMISFFLFQVSGFAQVFLNVISDPSAGEIQTNHNAQTARPGTGRGAQDYSILTRKK